MIIYLPDLGLFKREMSVEITFSSYWFSSVLNSLLNDLILPLT